MDTHAPLHDCPPAASNTEREPPETSVLTRRMAAGDETAYSLFYDAYFDRLWRYLIVVTAGNEDAAREALQATLTRVVRHIRIFSSEPAFWSWLTVLARSALSDQSRKRRRYLAFLERFSQHAAVESTPHDDRADERLQQLLDRHIAAELQTSEKTVESRLTRVRQKLKNTVLAELKNEAPD